MPRYKISKRFDEDISAVAAALQLDGRRRPGHRGAHRLRRHGGDAEAGARREAALVGKPWTEATWPPPQAALAEDFTPLNDWRASAATARWSRATCCAASGSSRPGEQRARASREVADLMDHEAPGSAAIRGGVQPAAAPRQRPQACHRRGRLYRRHARAGRPAARLPRPVATGRTAAIVSIDLDAVRAAPGVVGVLTAADIPGQNDVSPVGSTTTRLRRRKVDVPRPAAVRRRRRDPRRRARRAAKLAKVEYEELPPSLDLAAARDGGMRLRDRAADSCARGDAEAALAAAPHRLKGRCASAARTISTSRARSRSPCPARTTTSRLFLDPAPERGPAHGRPCAGRARNAVTVEVRRMGGGFGGKETQAQPVRRGRRARREEDRPRGQAPPRPRRRHGHDRQAPRLRQSTTRSASTTTAASSRSTAIFAARCGFSADLSGPVTDRALFHADNAYFYPGGAARLAAAGAPTPSPTPPSAASAARRA